MEVFWKRELNYIKKYGWAEVVGLIKFAMERKKWIPGILLAIPFVLLIRILRPLVWVRFGNINAGRIGHFTQDVEYYLAEKEVGLHRGKLDIFFFGREPANQQFAKMCARELTINSLAQHLWRANDIIPGGNKHVVPMQTRLDDYRDVKGLYDKTEPHLPFTAEEDQQGRDFLTKLGFTPMDKFVCLMVRDSTYMAKFHGQGFSYHNFRDSDIETYEQAALALAEKGYWVFRMGKVVHKPMSVKNPRVVDYANSNYRNDFLDIWLMANCFFCITTSTGLDAVSIIYRRPLVYVNFPHFDHMILNQKSIVVPKLFYWKKNKKRLTFKECLQQNYDRVEDLEKAGIEVKDLEKEDITEAVLEFEARLSGNWVESADDRNLQKRFMEEYKTAPKFNLYHGWIHPQFRLGKHFLDKHRDLLLS